MNAPNDEAKSAAVDLRKRLFEALEAGIENDWERVMSACDDAMLLASHCRRIEESVTALRDRAA